MADLEKLTIKICADTSEIAAAIKEVQTQAENGVKNSLAGTDKATSSTPALNQVFGPKDFSENGSFLEPLLSKLFSPEATLSEFEKQVIQNFEGIEEKLEDRLEEFLGQKKTDLEDLNVDPKEIEVLLETMRDAGLETIDDLIDNFSDTLEEAVIDLSNKIADAFVDMALKGEFSIKTIGDIFLKTFLDIIAKELIQKPLENLLDGLLKVGKNFLFGSATGGEISAGVPTFINEQGQEVFIPHTPGKIVNADQTRHMFGQSRGVVVNQNLSFDTAIRNDMVGTILQAAPLLVEHTKIAVLESLQGRRI